MSVVASILKMLKQNCNKYAATASGNTFYFIIFSINTMPLCEVGVSALLPSVAWKRVSESTECALFISQMEFSWHHECREYYSLVSDENGRGGDPTEKEAEKIKGEGGREREWGR